MNIEGFEIRPLTPELWDDFETVLGKSGISGCWCTYWLRPSSKVFGEGSKGGSRANNKNVFRKFLKKGPPGLLAYDRDNPIAWCRVTPRRSLPGLKTSRHFKTELSIEDVWSLSCFVIRRSHRGHGLTTVLTKAAIRFARDQGGRFLEVYPTDTVDEKHPSVIYTGIASTFERLGFKEVQRRSPEKPMMRLTL